MTILRTLIALGVLVGLGACNTVQGFGRDVQSGGAAVSTAAEDVQSEL